MCLGFFINLNYRAVTESFSRHYLLQADYSRLLMLARLRRQVHVWTLVFGVHELNKIAYFLLHAIRKCVYFCGYFLNGMCHLEPLFKPLKVLRSGYWSRWVTLSLMQPRRYFLCADCYLSSICCWF